jgi:F0F1-type ATP synthase membrane subunit b/b'
MLFASSEEHHAPAWNKLVWSSINFILFILILYFLLRYPVINFFKNRKKSIHNHREKSLQENRLAQEQIEKYKREIAHLDSTIMAITNEMKEQATKTRERLIEEGKNIAATIHKDVKLHAASEMTKMKDEIVRQALHEIIVDTKKTLEEKMNEKDHEKLYTHFIQKDMV